MWAMMYLASSVVTRRIHRAQTASFVSSKPVLLRLFVKLEKAALILRGRLLVVTLGSSGVLSTQARLKLLVVTVDSAGKY
jgi:hypothetical protein